MVRSIRLGKRERCVNSPRVAIELVYDRMDVVAVRGGRAVASKRIPMSLGSEAPAWVKAVSASGEVLRAAATQLPEGIQAVVDPRPVHLL